MKIRPKLGWIFFMVSFLEKSYQQKYRHNTHAISILKKNLVVLVTFLHEKSKKSYQQVVKSGKKWIFLYRKLPEM
ncbi:MAG: hypothetical protein PHR79_09140 [Bacteroidales bacterium]|nr:hypothetical protein [Bacteroidales bacterium]